MTKEGCEQPDNRCPNCRKEHEMHRMCPEFMRIKKWGMWRNPLMNVRKKVIW